MAGFNVFGMPQQLKVCMYHNINQSNKYFILNTHFIQNDRLKLYTVVQGFSCQGYKTKIVFLFCEFNSNKILGC